MNKLLPDTIVAVSTPRGSGAIALIRLSGPRARQTCAPFLFSFDLQPRDIDTLTRRHAHYCVFRVAETILDEVVITVYEGPNSYTGEDCVEIACHGSVYIQQNIFQVLLGAGARAATGGEFTMRAFLNGKMDLSQAEAVADLIASSSAVSHEVAMRQMRGGISEKIRLLRENLVNFASLIELELDFSEEDVEFADRTELLGLVTRIRAVITQLVSSFELGNVIKNGVPVAIVGKPNAGKSTLLNVLLEDERAIVSEIPGTTRDVIEDELVIDGVLFRLIDTAGLRTTEDVIEQIGVNKAYEVMRRSAIIIYLFDAHEFGSADVQREVNELRKVIGNSELLVVGNKIDVDNLSSLREEFADVPETVFISAKEKQNIEDLKNKLLGIFDAKASSSGDTIVTNARHAEALKNAGTALNKVTDGLQQGLPGDLLALEIRHALSELGNITGQVTSEDLLTNIFSRFCIGK